MSEHLTQQRKANFVYIISFEISLSLKILKWINSFILVILAIDTLTQSFLPCEKHILKTLTVQEFQWRRLLPEFLYGGLFIPCDDHMSGVVDGKEKDVPVAAEPGDEEGTGEGLEGQLDHLSGAHPGGGDTQHHQQTTQYLQSCVGACLIGPALSAGLAAWCVWVRLWTILS